MSLQVCIGSVRSLPYPILSKVPISGSASLNKKVAPNKATSNLDWEIGKLQVSLSIITPWIVGICTGQIFIVAQTHILVVLPYPWTLIPPITITIRTYLLIGPWI
jgi:hypothetical protein